MAVAISAIGRPPVYTPLAALPSARHRKRLGGRSHGCAQVDTAGLDILLVGDSVAMVVHGHDTTLPVTLDEMLTHCQAVSRGSRRFYMGFPSLHPSCSP